MLDRRSAGRLVDAWAGSALIRVGPRGYRELIMLHGLTEIALLPYDPGSTTDAGMILDDHGPRRLRAGRRRLYELYQPANAYGANSTEGYVRALIRSENGAEHARLLEVTSPRTGSPTRWSPSVRVTNSTNSTVTRSEVIAGQFLDVSRPGARASRRRAGDDGAALQVREVLHRAAAAHRRRPGRGVRRGDRRS